MSVALARFLFQGVIRSTSSRHLWKPALPCRHSHSRSTELENVAAADAHITMEHVIRSSLHTFTPQQPEEKKKEKDKERRARKARAKELVTKCPIEDVIVALSFAMPFAMPFALPSCHRLSSAHVFFGTTTSSVYGPTKKISCEEKYKGMVEQDDPLSKRTEPSCSIVTALSQWDNWLVAAMCS